MSDASAALEFEDVVKRFGTLRALDGCSFGVRPGRLTGFLGPNGAGKTTAMRAVFGLVELDEGAVRWRGAPITAADRIGFGYMPEERGLYPRMRIHEQLVYLGELCGRRPAEVARIVDSWLERFALTSRAQDRLDTLSHGNQQRVQLIAALVNEPELLILDEPFSGLDPLAAQAMADLLRAVTAVGATVLFSSHQLEFVEGLCEDVVIIDHGKVVLAGSLADLRAAAPQRIVQIEYRDAPARPPKPASVSVLDVVGCRVRLSVRQGVDLAAVVAAAAGAGEIVALSYEPPTLSELFRQAVG